MFEYTEEEKKHLKRLIYDIKSRNNFPDIYSAEYWREKMVTDYKGQHSTLEQIIDEMDCGFLEGEELV